MLFDNLHFTRHESIDDATERIAKEQSGEYFDSAITKVLKNEVPANAGEFVEKFGVISRE